MDSVSCIIWNEHQYVSVMGVEYVDMCMDDFYFTYLIVL